MGIYFCYHITQEDFKMIITVSRVVISPGKESEAEDFAKRVANYNKKQPGVENSTVMRPLQGLRSRISLASRFSSLAAWEELRKKRTEDPEWQALSKELPDYFVPNTMEWNQYEVIE